MAAYFDVTGEVYRIFIHKTLLDLDGTGFMSSYILEYDEQMSEGRDDSFTLLFTHEMESPGFIRLSSPIASDGELNHSKNINAHLNAYFTSPRIDRDICDASSGMSSHWYVEWIFCKHDCAYLLFIDCYLHRQTGVLDIARNGPLG
ncbi:hypothetical protein MAP00_004338 [Monascus purpureus]|nr:hypothetical protein MAP00_004338 [Monascus purpureus]